MFRDYLALQVGLSLEAIVRSLKFSLAMALCEIP
jgi:hypothetical protein